jgi:hypothetical protein
MGNNQTETAEKRSVSRCDEYSPIQEPNKSRISQGPGLASIIQYPCLVLSQLDLLFFGELPLGAIRMI